MSNCIYELANHELELIHTAKHYVFEEMFDALWRTKVPNGWLYMRDMAVINSHDSNDIRHISQVMCFVPDKEVPHGTALECWPQEVPPKG